MKKIIYAFILFLLSFNICYASTHTYERTEDNLRVNKKWKIDEDNIDNVLKAPSVDASEKVYDFANILTDDEEKEVKELIDEFIKDTGFDLVFVSDSFSYSYDHQNEDYAADFYDYNDFGIEDKYYSGIVLFRNANSSDPYYGSYYFGEAQLYYSEEIYNTILDNIYRYFSNGYYLEGITRFIKDSTKYYNKGPAPGSEYYYLDENGYLHYKEGYDGHYRPKYSPPIIPGIVISIITTAITIGVLIKKNFMIAQETKAFDYLDQNSISYTIRQDQFITSHTSSYVKSSSSGYSGGGGGSFHSSGGSSGGGHSGGGRHG